MTDSEKLVLTAMENAGKPLRPGEISEITGIDKDEMSKILKILKKNGQIDSPKKCFYAPVK